MDTSWINGIIEDSKKISFFLIINCMLIFITSYQSTKINKMDITIMVSSEVVVWLVTFFNEIKYKYILNLHKLQVTISIAGKPTDKSNLVACIKESKSYNSLNLAGAIIYVLPLTNVLCQSIYINSATGKALTYFTILEIIYISFIYIHWHYICNKYKNYEVRR